MMGQAEMQSAVRALVLRAPGINCERETARACRLAGFATDLLHINQLVREPERLLDYAFLVIPGGFSYGDDLGAGTLLAKQLTLHLGQQLQRFIDEGRPVLGICNGFQVLVRAGLLPGTISNGPNQTNVGATFRVARWRERQRLASLTENASARFECRWVRLAPQHSVCIFTRGIDTPIELPVAHGEGQFVLADETQLARLQDNGQIAFTYAPQSGEPGDAVLYPDNPNGSPGNIAGVCNARGNVFGLMPHPERFVHALQHPQRRSAPNGYGDGLRIFKNAYEYARINGVPRAATPRPPRRRATAPRPPRRRATAPRPPRHRPPARGGPTIHDTPDERGGWGMGSYIVGPPLAGGLWRGGVWDGLWGGGVWDGLWGGGVWDGLWRGGVWDGLWRGGLWRGGVWDGLWRGGLWDGLWDGLGGGLGGGLAAGLGAYAASGVDIAAAERAKAMMYKAVQAAQGPEVLAGMGAFAGVFSAASLQNMRRPALVASTDGVGTKTLLAAQAGRYDGIGYDLVHHSVNDLLAQGARPLFFMDYLAMGRLDPVHAAAIVQSVASACKAVGCALLGGETAEMPDVYLPGAFDLAGTIVGVVEQDEIIDGAAIRPGDILLGLPSSGLHTNGYSLARRVFAPYALDTVFPELREPLIDALLRPHRCYLSEVQALRDSFREAGNAGAIKGIAHITGGGFAGNIARILPAGARAIIEAGAWDVPPLFSLIARLGKVERAEMYRAFNMGIGLALVLAPEDAEQACRLLPELLPIGSITTGAGVEVR
jgi:phosphoribosylformylglycinamidine synthase I